MVKKIIKTIVDFFLMGLLAIFAIIVFFFLYVASLDDPTTKIREKDYLAQRKAIEQIDTSALLYTKAMFNDALNSEGFQVDESYIRIWTNDGICNIAYYWKSGDDYYKTEVIDPDRGSLNVAMSAINSTYSVDKIVSARYEENGYITIETISDFDEVKGYNPYI